MVVVREIVADGRLQFADAPERAVSNAALGKQAEETLHLIQPTGTGGREMQMITGPPRKPTLYFGHLVRAIVVHHQMDVEVLRDRFLNPFQKAQELC